MATEARSARASDYETVFILRPDIDGEASEKVISRAISSLEGTGAKLTKIESWGKRRLAYPIGKQRKGVYVYLRYLGAKGTVAELERNLRMLDTVLRHMTVVLAKDVDVASVTVDPEEIKTRRIELSAEDDDRDESFEAQLGLADEPRRDRGDRGDRDRDQRDPTLAVEAPKDTDEGAGAPPAAEA